MSNADAVNWPDRIQETLIVPVNQAQDLIDLLEETILEDVSATEWTSVDCFRLGESADTDEEEEDQERNPLIQVRLRYDGSDQATRDIAMDTWMSLARMAVTGEAHQRVQRVQREAAEMTFRQSLDIHRQRRELYGDMVTRRQRESAERRRRQLQALETEPVGEFRIQWDDFRVWRTPDGSVEIASMSDAFLWHTLVWVVRNQISLFTKDGASAPRVTPALAAAWWLRDRPAFRALLKEAIRRCFTLPNDVFNYCKQYVLDRSMSLDGYQPWQDPQYSHQPKALQGVLDLPTVTPETELHKDFRSIQLD